MTLFLSFLGVGIEIIRDYLFDYKVDRNIKHLTGWIIRLIISICIAFFLHDPLGIVLYIGIHVVLFNPVMGFLIKRDILYLGYRDRFLLWLNSKIGPLGVFASRNIIFGSILVLTYFFPEPWLDLWIEILAFLN